MRGTEHYQSTWELAGKSNGLTFTQRRLRSSLNSPCPQGWGEAPFMPRNSVMLTVPSASWILAAPFLACFSPSGAIPRVQKSLFVWVLGTHLESQEVNYFGLTGWLFVRSTEYNAGVFSRFWFLSLQALCPGAGRLQDRCLLLWLWLGGQFVFIPRVPGCVSRWVPSPYQAPLVRFIRWKEWLSASPPPRLPPWQNNVIKNKSPEGFQHWRKFV